MHVPRGGRLAVALASIGLAARGGAAQYTPALWMDLVQMPVAVARLELAGIPLADLRLLVPALNVGTVSPGLFIESVRGFPFLLDRDGRDGNGMGSYVQRLHARGLRGPALADAIHQELRRRGVPAGPKHRTMASHDVLHRDFLPAGVRLDLDDLWDDDERADRRGIGQDRVRFEDRDRGGPPGAPRGPGRGGGEVVRDRPGSSPGAGPARGGVGRGGPPGRSRARPPGGALDRGEGRGQGGQGAGVGNAKPPSRGGGKPERPGGGSGRGPGRGTP